MYHSRPEPPATAHGNIRRSLAAGRLRAPETRILATLLAKLTENYIQEVQIRETVLTFRSSRALNCDTVATFRFYGGLASLNALPLSVFDLSHRFHSVNTFTLSLLDLSPFFPKMVYH